MQARSKAPVAWNLKTRAVSQMRRLWRWSPDVKEALERARVEGRWGKRTVSFRCACCGSLSAREDVSVDHLETVVPITGWDSWEGFMVRLFCPASGLQVLCGVCHAEKTAAESAERAAARRAAKRKEGC